MNKCTGQLMAKYDSKKLQEGYKLNFKNATLNYNGYIKSGIAKGKKWLCGNDKNVCKICLENQKAGIIPLTAKFPSGHLYPPAGVLCRCSMQPQTAAF